MPDPITTAIATAVAGSAATALTAEASRILKEITARVRRKLHGNPHAPAVSAGPLGASSSPGEIAALADALEQAFQTEPDFAQEVKTLWGRYLDASGNTYVNDFSGSAHTSVMVSENHGDLNING